MGMKKRTGLQNAVIIIAFLLIFGFRYLPFHTDLSTSAIQLLGIFAGVLLLWLFVSIDWPSILLLGALALIPELKFSSILASAYGGSTFVFLLFTFIVTYALQKTSFLKRLAVAFITSNSAKRGPWHFVILYFLSILFIGCFISPTVLFFVYYPILEEIAAHERWSKREQAGNIDGRPATTPELELFSDLLAAAYSGDPEYALEKIEAIKYYLHKQQIEVVDYSEETAQYFDLMPGTAAGTIRPAMVANGGLLRKGLASTGR